jgi:hypothetical protein
MLLAQLIPHASTSWLTDEDLTRPEVMLPCIHDLQQQHLIALDFKLSLADLTDHMSIAKNCISGLSDTDYRRFARRLMETDRAAYTDILAKDASRCEAIVEKRAGRVVSTVSASEKLEDVGPGPALSSLLEAFHAEGLRQGLVVKTLKGDETDLREFISVAGDKPIRNYVKADAIAFKDVLTRCPANRKSENYRGLTIADCAALAEKMKYCEGSRRRP